MSPYFPDFPGSDALAETSATDTNPAQYIFFNGKRIARIDPGATTPKYYVSDNVGSTELVTDYLGNPLSESLFYPYGVEQVILSGDTNTYKFSGKERDPESGLDNFGARYYASNLGRFMSPDWDAKPTTVPYASFGDPQTLNLYAYVENAPLNRVDANGHVASQNVENNWGDGASCGVGLRDCISFADLTTLVQVNEGTPEQQDAEAAQADATFQAVAASTATATAQQQGAAAAPAATTPYVAPGTAETRNAVLGILNGDNACSQFFNTAAGGSAAQIFSAVDIRLNTDSPTTGASTQEGKGADGAIFINKNGPFFNTSAIIGGKAQTLNVAPGYPGGFASTRKLIMLHELGHLVNALPVDGGNRSLSNQNTNTVIQHCSKELDQ
jgi:RHS repeat-associated protein